MQAAAILPLGENEDIRRNGYGENDERRHHKLKATAAAKMRLSLCVHLIWNEHIV